MSVIVSYVATPEGRAALDFGIRAARDRGETLKVVDGSGGRAHLSGDEGQVPYAQVAQLLEATGLDYTASDPVPPGANVDEATAVAVDDPASDIIVIGVRHRSAVGKFLLGSSAQRLILDADCPVVVVKARPQS